MEKENFRFKKEFGQNFILDKNFLQSVVSSLKLGTDSEILEIGAGFGSLSETLADNFKKVVSFEIDKTLTEHLLDVEKRHDNLTFIISDVLKESIDTVESHFDGEYYMVANLPYYITSQIIFKFLFETKNLRKMFVMVQKEVGERFCAKEKTKDYGVPTVLLNAFGETRILKNVKRQMFTPPPKVDSCIIEIDIDRNKFDIKDREKFVAFVKNCFKMKRKTLVNNLSTFIDNKGKIVKVLESMGLSLTVRPEELTAEQFVTLHTLLG